VPLIGHPEPSLCEGVRISNTLKDEIATSSNQKTVRLLAMTERVDGILTSHNTLLRMRYFNNNFHSQLLLRKQYGCLSCKYRNDFYRQFIESNQPGSYFGLSPSSSPSPIKGEGTLNRHCEERSNVAIS